MTPVVLLPPPVPFILVSKIQSDSRFTATLSTVQDEKFRPGVATSAPLLHPLSIKLVSKTVSFLPNHKISNMPSKPVVQQYAADSDLHWIERVSRFLVQRAGVFLVCFWLINFGICGLAVVRGNLNFGNLKFEDWLVSDTDSVRYFDALRDARSITKVTLNETVPERSTVSNVGTFSLDYRSTSPVFSPAFLQQVCLAELEFTQDSVYPEVCMTQTPQGKDTVCTDQFTPMLLFYSPSQRLSCPLLTASSIQAVLDEVHRVLNVDKAVASPSDLSPKAQYSGLVQAGQRMDPTRFLHGLGGSSSRL